MLTTTLNKILSASPCKRGWRQLTGQYQHRYDWVGNNDLLTIVHILEMNGFDDALWAVSNATDSNDFSAWCRYLVEKYYAVVIEPSNNDYFCATYKGVKHITPDLECDDYDISEALMMDELLKYINGDDNGN